MGSKIAGTSHKKWKRTPPRIYIRIPKKLWIGKRFLNRQSLSSPTRHAHFTKELQNLQELVKRHSPSLILSRETMPSCVSLSPRMPPIGYEIVNSTFHTMIEWVGAYYQNSWGFYGKAKSKSMTWGPIWVGGPSRIKECFWDSHRHANFRPQMVEKIPTQGKPQIRSPLAYLAPELILGMACDYKKEQQGTSKNPRKGAVWKHKSTQTTFDQQVKKPLPGARPKPIGNLVGVEKDPFFQGGV